MQMSMLIRARSHKEAMADRLALLSDATALNPQLVSLPRIQLMQTLRLYDQDGIEFRELQARMGMSDGKLLSNLYALRNLGVIAERKVPVEKKTVTTYQITDAGRAEWDRARAWLQQWLASP
jgi:DNA-binding MarR family transcriptional regulator